MDTFSVFRGNLKVGQISSMFSIRTGHNTETETISCHRKRSHSCRTSWQTTKDRLQAAIPGFHWFSTIFAKVFQDHFTENCCKYQSDFPQQNDSALHHTAISCSETLQGLPRLMEYTSDKLLATIHEVCYFTLSSILLFLYKHRQNLQIYVYQSVSIPSSPTYLIAFLSTHSIKGQRSDPLEAANAFATPAISLCVVFPFEIFDCKVFGVSR